MRKLNKVQIVINILCSHLSEDFEQVTTNKEHRYLLLLLLKNYNCLNREQIKRVLDISSNKSMNYNIKKAEEKFLINRQFRETYLSIEKYLEQVI